MAQDAADKAPEVADQVSAAAHDTADTVEQKVSLFACACLIVSCMPHAEMYAALQCVAAALQAAESCMLWSTFLCVIGSLGSAHGSDYFKTRSVWSSCVAKLTSILADGRGCGEGEAGGAAGGRHSRRHHPPRRRAAGRPGGLDAHSAATAALSSTV